MSPNRRTYDHYSEHADELTERYESVSFEQVHDTWLHLLAEHGGLALDVGAGSGRDAAWLAKRGWDVVAAEPAKGMRDEAKRRHPSPRIRWIDDSLPSLAETCRHDQRFDLVLVSAVWMHVQQEQRKRAFRKLVNLLRPGGLLVFTLRHGVPDPDRLMYPADGAELDRLGRDLALEPVTVPRSDVADSLGRPGVRWTTHVFRLPDDG